MEENKNENGNGENKIIAKIGALILLVIIILVVVAYTDYFKNKYSKEEDNNKVSLYDEENILTEDNLEKEINIEKESDFVFSFLKLENKKKNMIYSPLSIKYALNMLQEGANGETYKEINNVIGNLNLPKYKSIGKVLSLANGVFIRDRFYPKVKQTYRDLLVNQFNAEIIQDDFKNASNVNKWIEEKTLNIIKDMLSDDKFNDKLVMLLINALAIDMQWKIPFDDNDTYGNTFYLDDGTEMQATMMNREAKFNDVSYYMDDEVTALTIDLLQYEGTNFEFMAIMPENDLSEFVNSVSYEKIEEISNNLKPASNEKDGLKIIVPKFSYEYNLELKQDLQKLGINNAFNEVLADFTKIVDINKELGEKLWVSDAIHKAKIDFTEKGIKAAAVTVFGMESDDAVPIETDPKVININKPFLYLIRDKESKEIWFVGTVYEPNSWEKDSKEYKQSYSLFDLF